MRYLPFGRRRPPLIIKLTQEDAPELRRLHEQAFRHGWSAADFQNFLADRQCIGFGSRLNGKKRSFSGFILARLIGNEAEILTFAVARENRRRGFGRALLEHLLRFLYQQRAEALFLEADAQNAAALALYRAFGFQETGRRKAYYEHYDSAEAPAGADISPSAKRADISPSAKRADISPSVKRADISPSIKRADISPSVKRSDAVLFEYRLKQPYKPPQNL